MQEGAGTVNIIATNNKSNQTFYIENMSETLGGIDDLS
jgi:hypothetical protein